MVSPQLVLLLHIFYCEMIWGYSPKNLHSEKLVLVGIGFQKNNWCYTIEKGITPLEW